MNTSFFSEKQFSMIDQNCLTTCSLFLRPGSIIFFPPESYFEDSLKKSNQSKLFENRFREHLNDVENGNTHQKVLRSYEIYLSNEFS